VIFFVNDLPMDSQKRRENEKKFKSWEELPTGGRRYWYQVEGRARWTARYIKEVDADESTIRFMQEIYDETGVLREVHEKYPLDLGHRRFKDNES
jgi:hypothetical protein